MKVTPERRKWRNERRKYDKRTVALVDGLLEARRREWEKGLAIVAIFMRDGKVNK